MSKPLLVQGSYVKLRAGSVAEVISVLKSKGYIYAPVSNCRYLATIFSITLRDLLSNGEFREVTLNYVKKEPNLYLQYENSRELSKSGSNIVDVISKEDYIKITLDSLQKIYDTNRNKIADMKAQQKSIKSLMETLA